MNRRSLAALAVAAVCVPQVGACGGDDAPGQRDPLSSSEVAPDGTLTLFAEGVAGLPAVEPGGPPPGFTLGIGETCLFAGVLASDWARSECTSPRPGDAATMFDGGIHDDVSLAWLVTGDRAAVTARFWMLDGSTFDQSPILAEGWEDPPIVFGHAVPATNEIVGVELLDDEGHVLIALSINDR